MKILVADDDPEVLLLARLNLSAEGFRVIEASDGHTALELAEAEEPDLVLLDVTMPVLDGWDVLAALRGRAETRELPIVLVTPRAHDRDQIRGWDLGATHYLLKPFGPEQLLAVVRRALAPEPPEEHDEQRRSMVEPLRLRVDDAVYQLAAIVESSDDAIISTTLEGVIVSWNRGAEDLFGYTAEEAVGRSLSFLSPPDGLPHVEETLERIRDCAHVDPSRTRWSRSDGSLVDVAMTASPIVNRVGTVMGVSVIARRETDRRRAERKFEMLLESAPDAMVIVDADGTISLVNEQTERIFGYRRDELVGKPVELLVPERFRAVHRSERDGYYQRPRGRPMGTGLELYGSRKDGSQFPADISLSPLQTDEGTLVFAAIRDVSERKRAEQALADAYEREREAAHQLRQIDRMKSDFVSTVSHELRTPLTAILGFGETLTARWPHLAESMQLELVQRITAAAVRLDHLISDLLDFTRLERGQLRIELGPRELAPVVDLALGRLAGMLDGRPVELDVPAGLRVVADESALTRILENLITNADKFSPPGAPIQVAAARSGHDSVVLSVSDRGDGISSDQLERIFERFYRAPESRAPGTGIGLAIVKEFAEAQHGRVWAESTPGEGSTFSVELREAA